MKFSRQIKIKKALPILVATTVLSACVGGQEGDTNGGFAGVGGIGGLSGGTVTALGVIGGVALAGALLASDDDDDTVVAGNGDMSTDPVVDPDTDPVVDPGTDPVVDPGTDPVVDPGTDPVVDPGTDPVVDPGTDPVVDPGTDPVVDPGTDPVVDPGTDPVVDPGTTAPTGTAAVLASDGSFTGDFTSDQTIPGSGSASVGTSELMFDGFNGTASGCVTVPAGTTPVPANDGDISAVSLMIGPPGANGFPGVELEPNNADRTLWCMPSTLSAAQVGIIQQNLPSGNMYLAARNNNFPDGELRAQLLPNDVYRYSTTVTNDDGSSANGFVMVNEVTGDYSITWNTSDPSLVSAHMNDGIVSGASETVFLTLSQRPSNTARFFAYGNFNDPNDQLPNIEALLSGGQVWLDAHNAGDQRRFFGLLAKKDL